MKYNGGIYVIRVDGVGNYYGESSSIKSRWTRHRKLLYSNRHVNDKLRVAWKEYGPSKFTFEVLEQSQLLETSKHARLLRENYYISSDPMCLNVKGNDKVIPITSTSLPDRPIYRNREVLLRRVGRTNLVTVYDKATMQRLGVEVTTLKFKLGTFTSDSACRLKRKV